MNDLISRKSVLKAIEKLHVYGFATLDEDKLIETINKLPSVTLEEKTGHWIDITNKNGTVIALRCSCCENSPKRGISSDYCPNCGARMEASE